MITDIALQLQYATEIIGILSGIISFGIVCYSILAYRSKHEWILKLTGTPFSYLDLIRQDGSWKNLRILSKQVNHGNGIIHAEGRSFFIQNQPYYRKNGRPCYIRYIDNPHEIELRQYQDGKFIINEDGNKIETKNLFLTTKTINKPPYDSFELKTAIETKLWETLNSMKVDIWKMVPLIMGMGSIALCAYILVQINNIEEALVYTNNIIEQIATDAGITIPEIKPSIFK